jgi:hypothetical protein
MTDQPVTNLNEAEMPETAAAMALIDKTAALFAFKHPALIGPALADLMATWLSGHIVLDGDAKEDAKETKKMRHTVLDIQMRAVWQLVALKDADRKARGEKPQ